MVVGLVQPAHIDKVGLSCQIYISSLNFVGVLFKVDGVLTIWVTHEEW